MTFFKSAMAGTVALGLSALPLWAQETIKVGVLHSLSGTMAISPYSASRDSPSQVRAMARAPASRAASMAPITKGVRPLAEMPSTTSWLVIIPKSP